MIRSFIILILITANAHASPPIIAAAAKKSRGDAPITEQTLTLLDPDTWSAVQNADDAGNDWLSQQPAGQHHEVIGFRNNGPYGPDRFTLVNGVGRDGGKVLRITSRDTYWRASEAVSVNDQRMWGNSTSAGLYTCVTAGTTGSSQPANSLGNGISDGTAVWDYAGRRGDGGPSFWIFKYRSTGGGWALITGTDKFFVPWADTTKYTHLRVWYRWPAGFRTDTANPAYHETFQYGTYCTDDFTGTDHESKNWHFYHQGTVNYHLTDDEWIAVEYKAQPSHIRSWSGSVPLEPTAGTGRNYWSIMQRLYIDQVPSFVNVVMDAPYYIDIDLIEYVAKPDPYGGNVTIAWDSRTNGEFYDVPQSPTVTDIAFTITNNTASAIDGWIVAGTNGNSGFQLLNSSSQVITEPADIQVAGSGGTWQGFARVSPTQIGAYIDVNFVPDSTLSDATNPDAKQVSLGTPYVEWRPGVKPRGTQDSITYGIGLRID